MTQEIQHHKLILDIAWAFLEVHLVAARRDQQMKAATDGIPLSRRPNELVRATTRIFSKENMKMGHACACLEVVTTYYPRKFNHVKHVVHMKPKIPRATDQCGGIHLRWFS
jgi:hypothetical protein